MSVEREKWGVIYNPKADVYKRQPLHSRNDNTCRNHLYEASLSSRAIYVHCPSCHHRAATLQLAGLFQPYPPASFPEVFMCKGGEQSFATFDSFRRTWTFDTVSYTHLDVYKRQAWGLGQLVACFLTIGKWERKWHRNLYEWIVSREIRRNIFP